MGIKAREILNQMSHATPPPIPQDDNQPEPVGSISFALLWPVLQLVAVPLVRALLPYILDRIKQGVEGMTDDEIRQAVRMVEPSVRARFRQ